MYVCMCERIRVCMCICVYECVYVCMYVCMYVCVYVCMYVSKLCMYACMYVCIMCQIVFTDFCVLRSCVLWYLSLHLWLFRESTYQFPLYKLQALFLWLSIYFNVFQQHEMEQYFVETSIQEDVITETLNSRYYICFQKREVSWQKQATKLLSNII